MEEELKKKTKKLKSIRNVCIVIIVVEIAIIIGMIAYNNIRELRKREISERTRNDAYNSTFLSYAGTQPGTSVRALCDVVKNHNLIFSDDETTNIDIIYGQSAASINTPPSTIVEAETIDGIKKQIKAGKIYTVDFGYDKNSGLIVAVGIIEK